MNFHIINTAGLGSPLSMDLSTILSDVRFLFYIFSNLHTINVLIKMSLQRILMYVHNRFTVFTQLRSINRLKSAKHDKKWKSIFNKKFHQKHCLQLEFVAY